MKLGTAILAGGKNSRMKGRNKAFININGVNIIDGAIKVLKKRFNEITIVTNSPEDYLLYRNDCAIVTDIIKEKGPLCGIHSGLVHTSKDGVFFIACDMPFLHNGLIDSLTEAIEGTGFDCVLPYSDRGEEPLFAIYSKKILPKLEKFLQGDNYSIKRFLKGCSCKHIKVCPEESDLFCNINSLEDLERIMAYESKI